MNIRFIAIMASLAPTLAFAETAHNHNHLGGNSIFPYHSFTLEADYGQDKTNWDLDGWAGGDYNKLWLKSEGNVENGKISDSNLWALYSRNIATFWDAQIGLRYDPEIKAQQRESSYAVFGVNGLAPFFFETEAYGLLRDDGLFSIHLKQENDILITNRLILSPSLALNINSRNDAKYLIGSGLSDAEAKLMLRYEFTREFAPYVEYSYERKFGKTAKLYDAIYEPTSSDVFRLGIRFKF